MLWIRECGKEALLPYFSKTLYPPFGTRSVQNCVTHSLAGMVKDDGMNMKSQRLETLVAAGLLLPCNWTMNISTWCTTHICKVYVEELVTMILYFFPSFVAGRFPVWQTWSLHKIGAAWWRKLCNGLQRLQQVSWIGLSKLSWHNSLVVSK